MGLSRRVFLALAAAAVVLPTSALGEDAASLPRIGFLGNSTEALEANLVGPFRDALRELGYVDKRNVAIEYRWAGGDYKRLSPLVEELIAAKVDVIVTAGTPAALAVKKATSTIPLVMVAVGDPVSTGLVDSLAHPGGNTTGLTSIAPELEGKRLELIREAVPGVARIAVLWNPDNAYLIASEKQVRAAAVSLHLEVLSLAVRNVDELDRALGEIVKARVDALFVPADRLFLHNRERIVRVARDNRLPTMNAYRELAEAGGLMSFGPSYAGMHRQAAAYVDKILKGAKPGELPIEQPAKFEFVVNLKAAKELGLGLSQPFLLRADEVIE